MIDGGTLTANALVGIVAVAGGYLVGSIPIARWIAGAAGADPVTARAYDAGSGAGWAVIGPGAAMLALVSDIAKGVVPVAIGLVTWSWGAGWAAGLGALLGACWPAVGRVPGGRGTAVLAGVAFTLVPVAGVAGILAGLAGAAAGRLAGRPWPVAGVVAGLAAYVLVLLVLDQDAVRLGAILVLYLVVAIRAVTARSARQEDPRPSS